MVIPETAWQVLTMYILLPICSESHFLSPKIKRKSNQQVIAPRPKGRTYIETETRDIHITDVSNLFKANLYPSCCNQNEH